MRAAWRRAISLAASVRRMSSMTTNKVATNPSVSSTLASILHLLSGGLAETYITKQPNHEDVALVEGVQRGFPSPGYNPGRSRPTANAANRGADTSSTTSTNSTSPQVAAP